MTYTIHSPTTGRTLKVTYKKGNFWKLEKAAGKKLTVKELMRIGLIVPPDESEIPAYQQQYPSLEYKKDEKEQSLYQQYVSAWHLFYNEFAQMPPKFTAIDGVNLKQIIKHLSNVGAGEKEGLVLFQQLLASWKKLEDFHQKNTDLKYINSQLNKLLNEVRKANGNQTSANGTNYSVGL